MIWINNMSSVSDIPFPLLHKNNCHFLLFTKSFFSVSISTLLKIWLMTFLYQILIYFSIFISKTWFLSFFLRTKNVFIVSIKNLMIYRMYYETWQLLNSYGSRLPYTLWDIKVFLQFISLKKCFSEIYFTLKPILL